MHPAPSEFVLDEGLDDDEDVLAFQTQRRSSGTYVGHSMPEEFAGADGADEGADRDAPAADEEGRGTAVVVDGMPLGSSRRDLDALLEGCGDVVAIRVKRLEAVGVMRARVEFADGKGCAAALERDGRHVGGAVVSVLRATEAWEDGAGARAVTDAVSPPPPQFMMGNVPVVLPDGDEVRGAFWRAIEAASRFAGQIEGQAKKLGTELEEKLHVSEKVAGAAEATRGFDNEYQVSVRVAQAAEVGSAHARELDQKLGVSRNISAVAGRASAAARIVAQEVDENLDLSKRARDATNSAMLNETVGPTIKSVIGALDSKPVSPGTPGTPTPRKKKNYQPSGVEQDAVESRYGIEAFEDEEGPADSTQ